MKILPYPDNPVLLCYLNKAYPFGIIQANANTEITKWMCTKCVNTVFVPNSSLNKFDLSVTGTLKASANNKTSDCFKKQLPDSILLIEVRSISNLTIWRRVASISWIIFFVLYHID